MEDIKCIFPGCQNRPKICAEGYYHYCEVHQKASFTEGHVPGSRSACPRCQEIAAHSTVTTSVFPPEVRLLSATKKQTGESFKSHPNSQRFHEILRELGNLHDKKQHDYGSDTDPFANVCASQDFGIAPWVGALVRLNDKVKRLQRFAVRGNLANESAEDSLRDIAVYAVIALVLYEEQSGKKESRP